MNQLSSLSTNDFLEALTPQKIRIGIILQAGMGLGALFFFLIDVFIYFLQLSSPANVELLYVCNLLTLMVFFAFAIFVASAQFIYRFLFFSPKRLESALNNELRDRYGRLITATPAEKVIAHIRGAMLIRNALFEMPTFFGLAVLFTAASNGLLTLHPWLWINSLPFVIFIILLIRTFPTKDRLLDIFENYIKGVR